MKNFALAIAVFLVAGGCSKKTAAKIPPPALRTLVTRPLMATSPQNLLIDPFLAGDDGYGETSFGQFDSFFDTGDTAPLVRTLQSVSPIGGVASIAELRDYTKPDGATYLEIDATFLGGEGAFNASIWISAGDVNAAPRAFADAKSSIEVDLYDNHGNTIATLVPGTPVTYGARQWAQYTTAKDQALPTGGTLEIFLMDFATSLQLAAPQVTSSALATNH